MFVRKVFPMRQASALMPNILLKSQGKQLTVTLSFLNMMSIVNMWPENSRLDSAAKTSFERWVKDAVILIRHLCGFHEDGQPSLDCRFPFPYPLSPGLIGEIYNTRVVKMLGKRPNTDLNEVYLTI